MADQFQFVADQVSAPATRGVAVVPHDANPLADVPKALWVGTGGHLTLRGAGGADVVLRNVGAGSARRSSLPLVVSGNASRRTKALGTM